MPTHIKRKIFESSILPVLTYGAQIWATAEAQNLKLIHTEIAKERLLSGIKFRDRIRDTNVRKLSGVKKTAGKSLKSKNLIMPVI